MEFLDNGAQLGYFFYTQECCCFQMTWLLLKFVYGFIFQWFLRNRGLHKPPPPPSGVAIIIQEILSHWLNCVSCLLFFCWASLPFQSELDLVLNAHAYAKEREAPSFQAEFATKGPHAVTGVNLTYSLFFSATQSESQGRTWLLQGGTWRVEAGSLGELSFWISAL